MSGKSKKTTADKTVYNQKQTKYISHSATKMVNRLSLSFYGENTLKMNKQVILDTYDDYESDSPLNRQPNKPTSLSRGKLTKPKTPIVRVTKQEQPMPPTIIKVTKNPKQPVIEQVGLGQKKTTKSIRDRSSSRSSRGKNGNSVLFNYISNRIDSSAKGWTALRPTQSRPTAPKKL